MGVWKERGLEVGRPSRMDAKPCGLLNVYMSGRLDVHHPCDPPCRWGLAVVMARFLFAQNPTKKTSFSFYSLFRLRLCLSTLRFDYANLSLQTLSVCFAFGFTNSICPVQLYNLRRLLRLRLRKLVFTKVAYCVALFASPCG